MGLSLKYFWSLTWYEWGVELIRYYIIEKEKASHQEFLMELTGQFMALFANANRAKSAKPFSRKDFFKLSYDTQLTPEADPELFARVAKRLGGTIKKKKGSGDK